LRISAKGQVTIPKHVRDRAGMHEGTEVDFVFDDGIVTLRRVEPGRRGKSRGQRMVEALRGTATINRDLSTDEIMRLLRGETYAEEFEGTGTDRRSRDETTQRSRGDG
jgi:AbrB family looped-hinge helix DNA binding protein